MCLRALYLTPTKRKKIWVFCTHLSAEFGKQLEGKEVAPPVLQIRSVKQQMHMCIHQLCDSTINELYQILEN